MSTTGRPPFDPRRATELAGRSSDDPRWRDVHRHIELAQAGALAADLLKALDPSLVQGPEILGRVLVSGRRLGPAARARLADAVFEAQGRPIGAVVKAAFPPGSESRLRLGHAILGAAAGRAAGVPIRLLEAAVENAVAELTHGLGVGPPVLAADEIVPRARFLDGHRVVFDGEGVLPELPPSREARPAVVPEAPPLAPLDRILLPRLRAAATHVEEITGQLKRARLLVAQIATHGLVEGCGVKRAHVLLEHAQFRAEVARELLRACRSADRAPWLSCVARIEIACLREDALSAFELLQARTARGLALGPNPGDFGEIDRRVREVSGELAQLQAKSEVLIAAAEDHAGSLGLDDMAGLGCAYGPAKSAPQTLWDEPFVRALADQGRRLGALREQHERRHDELASAPPAGAGGARLAVSRLSTTELAALLKRAGVDLARVDPLQLAAATRTLMALQGKDRRPALSRILEGFRVLATVGTTSLPREEALRLLRLALPLPPAVLDRLSDGDLQDKLQEVASLLNAGPGPALVKLGAGTLRFTVGRDGRPLRASYFEPGPASSLRAAVRGLAPLASLRLRLPSAPRWASVLHGRSPRMSGALAFAAYRLASGEAARARQRLGAALVARQGDEASRHRPLVEEAQARTFASVVAGAVAAARAAARFLAPQHGRGAFGPRRAAVFPGTAEAASELDALLQEADLPAEARTLAAAARLDLEQPTPELGPAPRAAAADPEREDAAAARFAARRARLDEDLRQVRRWLHRPVKLQAVPRAERIPS